MKGSRCVMENAMVKVFENSEFGKVRMMDVDGQVMFGGSDVAKALGYSNTSKAINDHCKGITRRSILTNGGMQEINFITEGDVYRLIIRSRLPEAQKFEHWLFDEALPAMRKGEIRLPNFNNPVEAARAWADVEEAKQIAETKVAELAPKAEVYDKVMSDEDLLSMAQVAQFINIEGFGQNKLYEFLRNHGVLMESRRLLEKNRPYQSYVNKGWFVVRDYKTDEFANSTTYVTQKGAEGILRLVYKYNGELDDILYTYHQSHKKARQRFRDRFFGVKQAPTLNISELQEMTMNYIR